MSPASKSKSKDKTAARAVKEQPKCSKPSVASVNGGNGVTAVSGYNPISGTFHALETLPTTATPTTQSNGRFRTIDETDEHSGSSLVTTAEYDSLSNNDSCSGESEDQQKEKNTVSNTSQSVPGSDIDKREKIRLKNEKKHQRQKERRAQELHERCCSYLTSRKLESLAQKLVAMGFTSEQATMALIQNEGRVDDSALWLLEGGDESKRQAASNLDGASPKLDIADELAKIAELESKFKCTKQEVERAIVACEGDLEKAEETMKAQKQDTAAAPTNSESAVYSSRLPTSSPNSATRAQVKGISPANVLLQRRDERDLNYTKSTIAGAAQMESASKILQHTALRKVPSKQDWTKSQAVVPPLEKKYSLQVAAAQAKAETPYISSAGNEIKPNLLQGTLREPIFMMQRPQSNDKRQNLLPVNVGLSASVPASTGGYPNMIKFANGDFGQQLRNLALAGSSNPQQFYPISSTSYTTTIRSLSSSSLSMPSSSLGLFTGWGSSGSSGASSPVDWSTRGSIPQCDYTSIDWSLDSTELTSSSSWSSSIKGERLYDNSWHASYAPSQFAAAVEHPAQAAGSREWTSPFAGKDIFRVPRQFVTSPSP
ncbi:uncharacterized protein A4U43_C08F30310 [Asparagus officinalis]|uniref:uncharacterized protein LOC109851283 n=1 Tax=Asparagus officinalis TaxID=4686 RepID=UPI00098E64C3|nr:uncharacterized protein LOC109851283 [Asparagus officinalis]ONK61476.1 uncharacterized protein A4U43_C08F30310 [Asparagus officinalis]